MKNLISILLLSFFAITGLAQQSEDDPPANPKAVIIKGLLTDVPDGTEIMIFRRDPQSSMGFGIESAKVKNGKFSIVIRPKGWKEEYSISPYDRKKKGESRSERLIFATPGTTTTVTGSGLEPIFWEVENDNPLQASENIYNKLEKENWLADEEFRKISDAYVDSLKLAFDSNTIKRLREWYADVKKNRRKSDSLNVVMRLEWLEQSDYNAPFASKLSSAANKIWQRDFRNLRERARMLFFKVPEKDASEANIANALQKLYPKYDKLKPGMMMPDIPFYDIEDKERLFKKLYGNGKYKVVEIYGRHFGGWNRRPQKWLDYLYENYSRKVELLFFNYDDAADWKKCARNKRENKNCDPWIEWSDHNFGMDLEELFSSEHIFAFFSPDGKFLGFRSCLSFKDGIDEYLPFVDVTKVK